MTTYTVTTSNWNSPGFWSGINESGSGHTLDFSTLGTGYTVDFDPDLSRIVISDGATTFTVGDSDHGGSDDAQMSGTTQLQFFTHVLLSQGQDTYEGTSGADSVRGQDGNDSLSGAGGNDTLHGDAGDDTLLGGAGNDTLYGGAGDDSLVGGTGTNSFDGQAGADTLDGTSGDYDIVTYFSSTSGVIVDLFDSMSEWGGDAQGDMLISIDQVDGSNFADYLGADDNGMQLIGFAGDDTIQGGDGADTLQGGDGADMLFGWLGDDSLLGGAGDDILQGEHGNDTLRGDAGDDTFYASEFSGNDLIDGGASGTTGDVIDLVSNRAVVITLSDLQTGSYAYQGGGEASGTFSQINGIRTAVDNSTLDVSALGDDVTVTLTDNYDGTVSDGVTTFTFAGVGTLILSSEADLIDASASWEGVGGDNVGLNINAGFGDDTVLGGNGGETIDGGAGNDSLDGAYGDDSIFGGDGADTLIGSTGNDTLVGGAGGDLIDGGVEADTLIGDIGNDTITGGDGNDRIWGNDDDDVLTGGSGNDTLYGDAGNDTIGSVSGTLSGGDDQLFGGAGSDSIYFGNGQNTVDGGDDADFLYGQGSAVGKQLTGGEGGMDDDTLSWGIETDAADFVNVTFATGESGSALIRGQTVSFSQIEKVEGTQVDDTFDASAASTGTHVSGLGGDDSITGSGGSDTFFGGDGADTISGGDGDDYIEGGLGDDYLISGIGQDTLLGGAGNDTLQNSAGDDSLVGGTGDDSIIATLGDDTLEGGDGNDTLDGGADNDQLEGGAGDDLLTGGDGNDTFIYNPGDGNDTITDFNAGNTGTLDDGDSTNNDFINLSGFYDHISELYADLADDNVLNQSNTTDSRGNAVDYSNNDDFGAGSLTFTGASADSSSFTAENTGVTCFVAGTRIDTPRGPVRVEDLRIGDLVCTQDHGPQPVRWVGGTEVGAQALAADMRKRPVVIKAGVLGARRDLMVSAQHGIVVGGHLVRAAHLAQAAPGVRVAHGRRHVRYVHLLCAAHEIIRAEGVASETFYPGPMALRLLAPEQRRDLIARLPQLCAVSDLGAARQLYGPTARQFLARRDVAAALAGAGLSRAVAAAG